MNLAVIPQNNQPDMADRPIGEVFEAYLAGQISPGTKRIYERDILQFFGGSLSRAKVASVEPQQVAKWRDRMKEGGLEHSTINRKMAALDTFYRHLIAWRVVTYNPATSEAVKRFKTKWDPALGIEVHDINAMLEACRRDKNTLRGLRDQALIALCYTTLLRRHEAADARWERFVKDGGRWLLVLPETKAGRPDRLPIEKPVQAFLERLWEESLPLLITLWQNKARHLGFRTYIDQHPVFISLAQQNRGDGLSTTSINNIIKGRAEEVGLAGVHAHSLRHSGITHLLESGENLHDVSALARHSSTDLTMRYWTNIKKLKRSGTRILAENLGA